MARLGIYPGTFDPITKGHQDIIYSSLNVVDKLIIAVADDIPKTPIFSLEEREAMVRNDIERMKLTDRVEVSSFKGLLVDFAKSQGASVIIRGLRAVSDYEYEIQLAAMNKRLNDDIQTILLPASDQHQFLASRLVKEVARLGGDISPMVSSYVAEKLKAYYKA